MDPEDHQGARKGSPITMLRKAQLGLASEPARRCHPEDLTRYRVSRMAPLAGTLAGALTLFATIGVVMVSATGPMQTTSAVEATGLSNVIITAPSEVIPPGSESIPLKAFVSSTSTSAKNKPGAGKGWFVSPVPDKSPSGYGMRLHPILNVWRMHNGDDLTAACGEAVVASATGTVTYAGANGGYGNLVTIDHGKHGGKQISTNYAHLSVIGVKVGQKVKMGQGIAKAGNTGLSTACHLHFEVMEDGGFVDPTPYLIGKPSPTAKNTIPDLTPGGAATSLDPASLKARIRFCESSNNYAATNPRSTASGAYQFLDGTWRGIPKSITGGTTRAMYATPAQQDAAFDWLYARSGSSPWASSQGCWGRSNLTVPSTTKSAATSPQPTKTTTSSTPKPTTTTTTTTKPTTTAPAPTTTTTTTSTPTKDPEPPTTEPTTEGDSDGGPTVTTETSEAPTSESTSQSTPQASPSPTSTESTPAS